MFSIGYLFWVFFKTSAFANTQTLNVKKQMALNKKQRNIFFAFLLLCFFA